MSTMRVFEEVPRCFQWKTEICLLLRQAFLIQAVANCLEVQLPF